MEKKATKKAASSQGKSIAAPKAREPGMKYIKKEAPGRGEVEILAETFEPGEPVGEDAGKWRQKLASRDEKLKYLKTGERYWYSDDWFGSEKRKNPA